MAAGNFLSGPTEGSGRWSVRPTTLPLSPLFVKACLFNCFSLLRFDRHNIVVLASGDAAINFERSFSDEPAWCIMMKEVWNDMTGESNGSQTPNHENLANSYVPVETFSSVPPAKELCWEVYL